MDDLQNGSVVLWAWGWMLQGVCYIGIQLMDDLTQLPQQLKTFRGTAAASWGTVSCVVRLGGGYTASHGIPWVIGNP